jgi:hypothetical protein
MYLGKGLKSIIQSIYMDEIMRVWVVSKETDSDLNGEQIIAWKHFLNLAIYGRTEINEDYTDMGCSRAVLAEDSDRIIAVSFWKSQEALDAVLNSDAYKKVGEKVVASWGDQMVPNHELTFNGKIVTDSDSDNDSYEGQERELPR